MMRERPICFWLFRHAMRCALALAFANAGSNSAARMAMMAMTTSNSISVKALRGRMLFFIQDAPWDTNWTLRVARHVHTIYLLTSAVPPDRRYRAIGGGVRKLNRPSLRDPGCSFVRIPNSEDAGLLWLVPPGQRSPEQLWGDLRRKI